MPTTPEVSAYMADMARRSHRRFDAVAPDQRKELTAKATYARMARRNIPSADKWLREKFGEKRALELVSRWEIRISLVSLDTLPHR